MSEKSDIPRFPFPPTAQPSEPGLEMRDLMAKCPVSKVRLPDDSTAWLVTGFQETREVMGDQRYSRALVFAPGRQVYGTDPSLAESIVGMDPPEHTRLRRLMARAFSQKHLRTLRPSIAKIVDDLIDELLTGPRPVDLVHTFSLVVPSHVTCLLLGIPATGVARFHTLANDIFGDWNQSPDRISRAYLAMGGFMARLIKQKRAVPGNDLVSMLLDPRDPDDELSDAELVKLCVGLLGAGHETTANAISMSFIALSQHPRELARMIIDPGLIPTAIEELLRYVIISGDGFIPLPRITTEEVQLGGVTIPPGEVVLPTFDVANRDPAAFHEPDRLDVDRGARIHLAFGAGVHHCLGASLARMELQEAFRGLLTRLPGLRLAVPISALEFRQGHRIASAREIPVTWNDK